MSQSVTVQIPDELLDDINKRASADGATPGEWISRNLSKIVRKPDERLRRHFGSVDLGAPIGIENVQIDTDLACGHGSRHEPMDDD